MSQNQNNKEFEELEEFFTELWGEDFNKMFQEKMMAEGRALDDVYNMKDKMEQENEELEKLIESSKEEKRKLQKELNIKRKDEMNLENSLMLHKKKNAALRSRMYEFEREKASLSEEEKQEIRRLQEEKKALEKVLESEIEAKLRILESEVQSADVGDVKIEPETEIDVTHLNVVLVTSSEEQIYLKKLQDKFARLKVISNVNQVVPNKCDFVVFVTDHLSHTLYYKIHSECDRRNLRTIKCEYSNADRIVREIMNAMR